MKAFVHYLLSLCILLIGGYSQVSAHAYKEHAFACPATGSKASELTRQDATPTDRAVIFSSTLPSGTQKGHYTIEIAENEVKEEELVFSKKYLESSNFFAAVVFASAFGYFLRRLKKRLPSSNRFSCFESYKWFIRLRVIRI